ncbi:hypothetical protein [Streptomyces sp. NPDC060027]|uniref:hypothetical protein n=1 Tax=Streptomyces sp. NPDC060027 TaxID=3347040 RepID=UPI0036748CB1
MTLPETGVCGGSGLFDGAGTTQDSDGGGCCAAPATREIGIGIGSPAPSGGC